jgi:NDP-sugar pyrophosphorylase family protein
MQAIILATTEMCGLSPLTESLPSAMLPVLSRPVMVGAVEQLAQQGIKNVFVSLSHLPGSVEAYFGTGQRWNLSIEYLLQRESWGSAGALKWAENLLTEPFLVLPADQVFELDIQALLAFHNAQGSQATLVGHPRGNGPGIELAPNGQVNGPRSGPGAPTERMPGTGIFLFDPRVLPFIPARTVWDIYTHLIPELLRRGVPVVGYRLPGLWHSIGSFKDFQAAHWKTLEHFETRKQANPPAVRPDIPLRARQVARGIWVGRNTLIHPTARLSAPVFVGENSFIGREVALGPEAMVGANALVDDGATVAYSTVLDHTYVGQFVNVHKSVASAGLLVDVETGESTQVVDQFLLGEARTGGADSFVQRLPERVVAFGMLLGGAPLLGLAGFLALIATGKVLTRVQRFGRQVGNPGPTGEVQLRKLDLWRFSTRRANGRSPRLVQWLERGELHRLPELWNVVFGDLRLIGVKSLSLEETGKMIEKWQQKRNEYAPGFSGLWYLQTTANSPLDEILITDAYYVATRNWREDIRIFWQTLPTWWKRAWKPST